MFVLKCKECGKTFQSAYSKRVFCSRKCQHIFTKKHFHQTKEARERISMSLKGRPTWNKGMFLPPRSDEVKEKISRTLQQNKKCKSRRYTLVCAYCGKTFQSKAPNAKVCPNCLYAVCTYCGKEFKLSYRELKEGRKYCSQKCYHDATKGREPWNKNYVLVKCQMCGKEFEVPFRRKETAKYCSDKCKYDAMSQRTGEKNPLWKGGGSFYSYMLSQNEGSFYRNRIKVLKRDNYTCAYCGYKGESSYMDVHHIVPVREGGSNTEKNMITLCRKCHNHADHGMILSGVLLNYVNNTNTRGLNNAVASSA